MFLSQLKIIVRNFIHKPLYPIISVVVLSIGIACIMLTTVWMRDELSYDSSYSNSEKMYRLTIEKNDKITGYHTHIARSTYEWLKNIKNDIPGIKDFGRFINRGETPIKIDSSLFNSRILKAKDDFIRVFPTRFILGNPENALKEPNTAIISKSASKKYFGSKNPVGETIKDFLMNSPERKEYKITALVEDLPVNSHFHFDFVLTMDKSDSTESTWYYNYIILDDNVNPSQIIEHFNQFAEKYISDEAKTLTPYLQKITDIHLESMKDRELEENGNKKVLYLLGALSLFVFFVSILNFLNLQYVVFLRKYKTVLVLDYAGAKFRNHLLDQFLESLIYGLVSTLTGMYVFELCLKHFNLLLGKSPEAGNEIIHSTFIVLIPAIILIISIAGLYPFLMTQAKKQISSVLLKTGAGYDNPLLNYKKRFKILKTLITVQYIFSIILLITVMVVNKQVRFIMNHRLGNNQNNIICVKDLPVQVHNKYQIFKSELMSNNIIKDVTSSFENPSSENLDMLPFETSGIDVKDKMVYVYPVDDNFFDFYNIKLLIGRNFRKFEGNDSIREDYILNETAVKYLGWKKEEAVGKHFSLKMDYNGKNIFKGGTISGVVEDFQMSSMKNNIKPYVFFQKSFWLFSAQVKYDSEHLSGALTQIEKTWKKLFPDYPLEYDFVEDLYSKIYKNEIHLRDLSMALGLIAVVLSCLGLWGITGIIYEARTKEIGIRKINGAKILQIVLWLLKDILMIVAVALVLAIPISFYLMNHWLNNFAYKAPINWWIFSLAGLITFIIAVLTVSLQSWRAATRNPVEALRYE